MLILLKNHKFTDDIIQNDDYDLADNFDHYTVEAKKCDKDKYDPFFDQESNDPAVDEFHKLNAKISQCLRWTVKYPDPVGEESKQYSQDPGDDIGKQFIDPQCHIGAYVGGDAYDKGAGSEDQI